MQKEKEPFAIKKAHKFYTVNAAIVEKEIRSGLTVTFSSEVDLSNIEAIRVVSGDKPSYTAFVIKALARTLQELPYGNRRIIRSWIPGFGDRLQQFTSSDIAVACERQIPGIEVATFIDVLRSAEQLTLGQITEWLRKLSQADEENNPQWKSYKNAIFQMPTWLSSLIISLPTKSAFLWCKWRGGAALISSPAKYGVDSINGCWMHPLGVTFGVVKKRVLVKDEQMVICPTFTFSLNFDRRVMAGAQAARFFQRLIQLLENPSDNY